MNDERIKKAYQLAKDQYAELGIDTEHAMQQLIKIALSLHCWQGDDVGGFETSASELGGGLAVTGNYPGKARNADELRQDLDQVYRLIPGKHRLNLHAIYAETGGKRVERDQLLPEHFSAWLYWAKSNEHGLDFNPTCFSHPLAESGFTLASLDAGIRQFWVDHVIASRHIAATFGSHLNSPSVNNIWIPDGYKDTPADRKTHRLLLKESLDQVFAEALDPKRVLDSVESKLFGIGSESYVVGSHEFYLAYALQNDKLLCLDSGHFHPTESVADKLSAVLTFLPGILLHISRGVRWDSDHVVTLNDEVQAILTELARGDYLERVHIGLDYFDASINRIAAWTIGARNVLRGLLIALLEPTHHMQTLEQQGDFTARLILQEALKSMPFGAVWDQYCLINNVPSDRELIEPIRAYEKSVLSQRS